MKNPDKFQSRLVLAGAKKIEVEDQKDFYFSAPHRDFGKTDELLRIREAISTQKKCFITYKGPRKKALATIREEFEVQISNAKMAIKILKRLGFRCCVIVEKRRQIYRLNDLIINLDNVKGLGKFVEIEVPTTLSQPKLMSDISVLLKELKIKREEIEKRTYFELFLHL